MNRRITLTLLAVLATALSGCANLDNSMASSAVDMPAEAASPDDNPTPADTPAPPPDITPATQSPVYDSNGQQVPGT